MGVQHLSASMASLSCATIHDVTTRIRNIVRHILGGKDVFATVSQLSYS